MTLRNKKMISLLLENDNYLTIQFIAEKMNVSSRTVLRELNSIENWLNRKGIALEKKKGIGIRINLQEKKREALTNYVENEKVDLVYLPEQRLTLLKAELLKNTEITKLYTLTRLLEVTEATISSDIDKLEPWMNKYNLRITKKSGLGVFVEGNEKSIRSAIISLIYEQFHEAELLNIIFNKDKEIPNMDMIKTKISQGILEIMDINILELTKKLLRCVEKEMNCQFADNSYIALVIRISVTIHRCRKGIFISEMGDIVEDFSKDKLYYFVKYWFVSCENLLPDTIPEEEINYMLIHIKGAEIREEFGRNLNLDSEDFKIAELTKEVILIAERETGIYLEDNQKLLRGLAGHLKMAVYRIKMHLDIMNPLLEEIKEIYPELFQVATKCAEFIEEREKISIPEDEIAHLATYIGAAVKKEKNNTNRIYRAVVACTNDIGAAQLLVSEIEREFPNIKISSIVSVVDLDIIQLTEKRIDIIITTVELHVRQIPSILVNPILSEEDKRSICNVLENFLPENINYRKKINIRLEDKLKRLKIYSDYILQVMHNFIFIEQVVVKDIKNLYFFISRTIAKTGEDRVHIEKDLANSEKKGAAILDQEGIILYHCRSEYVRSLSMVVVRMKDYMDSPDKNGQILKSDTVIVLAVPLNANNYALEIMNIITRKIINTDFSTVLKQYSKEDAIMEVNGILDSFIQNNLIDMNTKE